MASSGQTFSLNETASLLGVTRQSVDRWMKLGCPYVERADPRTGKQWQLSLPDVVGWRERRAVEAAIGDTSKLDIDEARRRKTAAEAALAELELAKQRGEVVAISVVQQVVGDQLSACRSKLLGVAVKTGPLVAPLLEPKECTAAIDAAQREALDELIGWAAGYDARSGTANGGNSSDDHRADAPAAEANSQRMGRQVQETVGRGKRGARPVGDGEE